MKGNNKYHAQNKPQSIIVVLVVTSTLSLSAGLTLMHSAMATPINLAPKTASEIVNDTSDRLPPTVANAVVLDLSRRVEIPAAKLKIIKYSRETWSDGCLGLSKPDEFCTQALVEGWRVFVSDGCQTWIYRTDESGRNLRLEAQTNDPKVMSKA